MPETVTATAPDGIVHKIDPELNITLCNLSSAGWSRAITRAQLAGLVVFCEGCEARDA